MPSNHLILCCPLHLLPLVFLSIRVLSSESALRIRWPKYWSFSLASTLPINIQGLFHLGLTGLISLLSKGLSRVFTSTTFQKHQFFNTQFSSVQLLSRVRLCDPMNRSMPGLPVHHHLPEFTQTHVHRVRDAIQPSHPLSSPSPPAPNPSQHQSLFQ